MLMIIWLILVTILSSRLMFSRFLITLYCIG
ncbi:hypothetical protein LINPERPRIM_LOCUS5006 [Linum perenne]